MSGDSGFTTEEFDTCVKVLNQFTAKPELCNDKQYDGLKKAARAYCMVWEKVSLHGVPEGCVYFCECVGACVLCIFIIVTSP